LQRFLELGRGVRDAVWFDFEAKSHLNRKIKKHAVWFGSVGAVFSIQYNILFPTLKSS